MPSPKVKNVSKGSREVDGYEYFSDWISDVENNIYIGQNATKYAQCPMPESKWISKCSGRWTAPLPEHATHLVGRV